MKKLIRTAFVLTALWICGNVQAQEILASYGPNQNNAIENGTASNLSVGNGLDVPNIQNYYLQVNGWSSNNIGQAISNNDYIEWSVSSREGFNMILEQVELSFSVNTSQSGNAILELYVSTDDFNSSTKLYESGNQSIFNPVIDLDDPITLNGGKATFRLYGYKFNHNQASLHHLFANTLGADFSNGTTVVRVTGEILPTENASYVERLLASYGPNAVDVVSKASATAIETGGDISNTTSGNSYFSTSGFTSNTEAEAIANDHYIQWTISADEFYTLELTELRFKLSVPNASGPATFSLHTSVDAYGSSLYDTTFKGGQEFTVDLTDDALKVQGETITLRLYVYDFKKNNNQRVYEGNSLDNNPFINNGKAIMQLSGYLYSADSESPTTNPTTGGDVQITEIMIDPDNDLYYIELYNP
ncbi:MAG: hypothetical protein WBG71_13750, partial [Leeuwenhoekiella sp.]